MTDADREELGRVAHEASRNYRIEKQFLCPPPEWERQYSVHQEELRVMAEAVARKVLGRAIDQCKLRSAFDGRLGDAYGHVADYLQRYLDAPAEGRADG